MVLLLPVLTQAKEKEEVKILKPPTVYFPENAKYEKQIEELKKRLEILKLLAEISKYQSQMERERLQLEKEKLKLSAPVPPSAKEEATASSPKESLSEKLFEYRVRERQKLLMERKLELLQNLFTGVVDISGRRVALDTAGRKYTVGSYVYGLRIKRINYDSIVVTDGSKNYTVPLSSGLAVGKKSTSLSLRPLTTENSLVSLGE